MLIVYYKCYWWVILSAFVEAIKAVVMYTENPAQLLRRRKIRKEVLFRYAHETGIPVRPDDVKHVLMQQILKHWGSNPVAVEYLMVSLISFHC